MLSSLSNKPLSFPQVQGTCHLLWEAFSELVAPLIKLLLILSTGQHGFVSSLPPQLAEALTENVIYPGAPSASPRPDTAVACEWMDEHVHMLLNP